MNMGEVLNNRIVLRGMVAYEEPWRIDAVGSINGEVAYEVYKPSCILTETYFCHSLRDAIGHVNINQGV